MDMVTDSCVCVCVPIAPINVGCCTVTDANQSAKHACNNNSCGIISYCSWDIGIDGTTMTSSWSMFCIGMVNGWKKEKVTEKKAGQMQILCPVCLSSGWQQARNAQQTASHQMDREGKRRHQLIDWLNGWQANCNAVEAFGRSAGQCLSEKWRRPNGIWWWRSKLSQNARLIERATGQTEGERKKGKKSCQRIGSRHTNRPMLDGHWQIVKWRWGKWICRCNSGGQASKMCWPCIAEWQSRQAAMLDVESAAADDWLANRWGNKNGVEEKKHPSIHPFTHPLLLTVRSGFG